MFSNEEIEAHLVMMMQTGVKKKRGRRMDLMRGPKLCLCLLSTESGVSAVRSHDRVICLPTPTLGRPEDVSHLIIICGAVDYESPGSSFSLPPI